MLTSQRIIYSNNGTLSDMSYDLNDFLSDTQTVAVVAAEDYIYIGSEHPFSHRWFEVSTANDQASVVSVDVWCDSSWNAAVDVQDDTSSGGVSLARSGIIQWTIDRTKSWAKEYDSNDITGLSGTKIYDMYWVRLSFSADLGVSTALKYIGFKFATDTDIAARYAMLDSTAVKSAFASGKTDWNDQHFLAGQALITHMKRKQLIWSPDQLHEWQLFNEAATHKAAEIIFSNFGDDYEDDRNRARKYFLEAMDFKQYKVDSNQDGVLDEGEQQRTVRLIRQ